MRTYFQSDGTGLVCGVISWEELRAIVASESSGSILSRTSIHAIERYSIRSRTRVSFMELTRIQRLLKYVSIWQEFISSIHCPCSLKHCSSQLFLEHEFIEKEANTLLRVSNGELED